MGIHFGIYLVGKAHATDYYSLQQRQLVPSPVRRGKVRMGVALQL